MACDHGESPKDPRCVTECFGAATEGPQTMIERCMGETHRCEYCGTELDADASAEGKR